MTKTLSLAGICSLQRQIVIHIVYYVIMFVNAVPTTVDVSDMYSSQEITTQCKLDLARDYTVLCRAYVEDSDNAILTNTTKLRTHGSIALGPSYNWQGSMLCFDLETGKVMTQRTMPELPIPDCVKDLVNKWGSTEHGKKYSDCVEFSNRR